MRTRLGPLAMKAAVAVVVIVAAYGVGKVAASYYRGNTSRRYLSARSYGTDGQLTQMNTIRVGGIIPDHLFRSLGGDAIRLSGALQKRTLLLFFDPSCPSCLDQVEMVGRVATTTQEQSKFLIISQAEAWQLLEVQSDLNIKCPILCDSGGTYQSELNVHTSPFSILVNENRIIESIVSGGLLEEEINRIAHSD